MTTASLPAITGAAGSPLEQRMRRALAWYPPEWRAEHGEAMLGVLLDVAEAEGMPGPSLAQRLNLAGHGLWRQLLSLANARVRSLAATSALFGASAFALFHFVLFEWQPWVDFRPYALYSPYAWVDVVWLAGAALCLCGWTRLSRAVCAATAVGAALLLLGADSDVTLNPASAPEPWRTSLAVFVFAAVFLLAGSIRAPRRPGVAALATVGAAGAMFGLNGVASVDLMGFRLDLQAKAAVWWGDGMLWGAFNGRAVVGSAVVIAAVAAVVWALGRLGRRALAARISAVATPWLAFWAFHLLHDILLNPVGGVVAAWGIGGIPSFGLALNAPDRCALLAVFVIGCFAMAAVGARAIARARAEGLLPDDQEPNDQEPMHA